MANDLVAIQNIIYEIRGHKVMLDSDLATLYQVETFNLNKAVKRNIRRFPEDFMFQLTKEEWDSLIFHFGISKQRGGRRFMPYAFTEQGVAMLSAVLNSNRAIDINVHIMRAFVKMRQIVIEHKDLAQRVSELEQYLIQYSQSNNSEIDKINEAINLLMDRTKPVKIGFKTEK